MFVKVYYKYDPTRWITNLPDPPVKAHSNFPWAISIYKNNEHFSSFRISRNEFKILKNIIKNKSLALLYSKSDFIYHALRTIAILILTDKVILIRRKN